MHTQEYQMEDLLQCLEYVQAISTFDLGECFDK